MTTETHDSRPCWRTLAETDPEDRRGDPRRAAPAEQRPRADRVGELRQPRRARSRRLGADQQVRRRLPGQALLRRLRVRRRRRARGDRARQGALRRRPRQRAAALGRAGQHGGLHDAAQAGRHRARHEPRARRPPDARPPAEFLRAALHDRPVRRAQGRRADRLRRARSARRRAPAEDDHRRRQRVSARHRLRADPRGGRPHRRRGLHRHGAHRRPRRRRRPSEPGAALGLRHDDDAQDAARTARRAWCSAASSTRRISIAACFPGVQGGPLMHIIAAKAVCFKEAAEPAFAEYQRQIVANASAARGGAVDGGLPAGQRRHRQSPDARGRVLEGHHRQGRRSRARQGRHHGQQERDSVRPESADGRERHPRRHAGGDDARHARSRDGPHRRAHRARARRRPTTIGALGDGQGGSRDAVPEVPAVSGRRSDAARRVASRPSSRPAARWRARCRTSSRAPGQVEMAAAVARRVRAGRRAPRRGRHRHRQDARLPRSRDPQPPARAHLDRHQEPSGTDLLQGHSRAARRARRAVHRDLHEGPGELPLPASARSAERTAPAPRRRRTTCSCRSSASGRRAPRPATAPSSRICPRTCRSGTRSRRPPRPASAPSARATTTASSPGCASAPPRPTSSSSTTTCSAPTPRSGRARSARSFPACSHAIIDEAHQLEDVATQYFGYQRQQLPPGGLARDVERLARSARSTADRRRDEIAQGRRRAARSCARRSSASSPSRTATNDRRARRGARARDRRVARPRRARRPRYLDRRARSRRSDARAARPGRRRGRTTTTATTPTAEDAARARAARGRAARRTAVPAARRRRRLRLLRRVPRTGIFLRAAPIDVSAIVRELLLDRMRTTVLTSATLTVDGTLRLHPRSGSASRQRRRSPAAVGVRLRAAGAPVSAAADAGSAVARLRRWPPAARWSRS